MADPQQMMVTCPGCDGVVSVSPTGDEAEVRCPKCDEVVYTRNAQGIEWWAGVPLPTTVRKARWRRPFGWTALILGVAAFIASYNVGPRQGVDARLEQAAINPLFFVGVPLGLYWLWSGRKTRRPWFSDEVRKVAGQVRKVAGRCLRLVVISVVVVVVIAVVMTVVMTVVMPVVITVEEWVRNLKI